MAPSEPEGDRDLRRADLRGQDLSGRDLTGAQLTGADLSDAILRQANLQGADLSSSVLDRTCLEGADLSRANMGFVVLRRTDFRRAVLRGADLSGVVYEHGELAGADLSNAILTEARLPFADLSGASLTGATLDHADLSGANLERADLQDASVQGTRLAWVQGLDQQTRRELSSRGARIPLLSLSGRWAGLNRLVHRHPALFYLTSLFVVMGIGVITAIWIGHRLSHSPLYPLNPPQSGMVYEVNCGDVHEQAYDGQLGYIGGHAEQLPPLKKRDVDLAPPGTYLTERRGKKIQYRFRVSPGWYEAQLHFVATPAPRAGVKRFFDISIEDHLAARKLEVLTQSFPMTVLVKRWGVWVGDGSLDLKLSGRKAPARVSFIRIRRLDTPHSWTRLRGDP
jgi:hypothetical protein